MNRADELRAKFQAVALRAFERRVLHLIQGYGPVQDHRFREEHEESPSIIFLRAELDGEYPETSVTIYSYDRAQDLGLESRHLIWDPAFAEGDVADIGYMLPPERLADEILVRARAPELRDLTAASASGTDWRERYAVVERRAFELHVLDLVQGISPLQDARNKNIYGNYDSNIFLRAKLAGEYPKTRVRIYKYQRSFEREISNAYGIWDSDFAIGDVVDVEHMRSLDYIVGDIMMWARGG